MNNWKTDFKVKFHLEYHHNDGTKEIDYNSLIVHAEDEDRLLSRQGIAVSAETVEAHPDWRDVESAVRATKRLIQLARDANRRVHVLHISSRTKWTFWLITRT